jgi:hypothetical protein
MFRMRYDKAVWVKGTEKKEIIFLKKATKKLPLLRALAKLLPKPAGAEVFLLLFLQKKKCLFATSWPRQAAMAAPA